MKLTRLTCTPLNCEKMKAWSSNGSLATVFCSDQRITAAEIF